MQMAARGRASQVRESLARSPAGVDSQDIGSVVKGDAGAHLSAAPRRAVKHPALIARQKSRPRGTDQIKRYHRGAGRSRDSHHKDERQKDYHTLNHVSPLTHKKIGPGVSYVTRRGRFIPSFL